jgi:DNA topoisomerase-1
MKLVIVDSPAKAKTIEKYLGGDFVVDASGGHVRDLPVKTLGIDVKNNFAPQYEINPEKKETVKRLTAAAKKAEVVYLATDPDREGEAISWHLSEILNIPKTEKCRIVFNEITKKAVLNAMQNPREINLTLVDAQQARRVLDRLVGYKLSPVLCKKIKGKLSAGRVQSVALRLISEKEKEINAFKSEEYWTLTANLSKKDAPPPFKAMLSEKSGKKIKPDCKKSADQILKDLENAAYTVSNIKKSVAKVHAPAPYTTSTLQQDASNKLNLNSNITMQIAQKLYEGIDLKGEGHTALVTYIRTDSVRVSLDAMKDAKEYILKVFGVDFVPLTPNFYKSKKSSQDAHEAIRPISVERTPASLKDKLTKDQHRLYKLIYERFLASQMSEATYNTMAADIAAADYVFKASGRTPLFQGFTAIYESYKKDDIDENENDKSTKLPALSVGDALILNSLLPEQKFTKPPLRYTDASLIKALEEKGIGRPSTYATIIFTIAKRLYTEKEEKYIKPTELGTIVSDYMVKYFENIVNVGFTAKMEEDLDELDTMGVKWQDIIADFYKPLMEKVKFALNEGERVEITYEESDVVCEKCGAKMIIKDGKYGKYLACPSYPDCKNIKSLKNARSEDGEEEVSDVVCEKCGKTMLVKNGRYGKFLACPGYPDCKNIKPLALDIVAKCPTCGKDVAKRTSKKGKVFYGCTGYPECSFISWDIPAGKNCPKCNAYMVIKQTKAGDVVKCSNKDCKGTK